MQSLASSKFNTISNRELQEINGGSITLVVGGVVLMAGLVAGTIVVAYQASVNQANNEIRAGEWD
ncbi:MAG: class IIb bacteriocin, lactobin A/cerein 7B family [Clostridiaceae bacterium]|jgi:lactobin A/cerein 7B family class IIb bacteriocin|nr:class IIb bacteriocin, lactobin A/cerein 7B family [Clostridiaceae bacterium]